MQKSNPKTAAKNASRTPASSPEKPNQQKAFDTAMQAFHMRDFAKAKQLFEAAAEGPAREIGYAARQHASMCEQRLKKAAVKLESAEDLYNYGVSLMNQRNLDGAQASLEKALKQDGGDHVHYALALVLGLKQNVDGAVEHLKKAIELSPRNRVTAHNDPDFAELMQHASIRELLVGAS
jgi:tetratricopeptide (TPR) repeat protein